MSIFLLNSNLSFQRGVCFLTALAWKKKNIYHAHILRDQKKIGGTNNNQKTPRAFVKEIAEWLGVGLELHPLQSDLYYFLAKELF